MQKLISIVIPAYNAENFITETINSVIKQSYLNWELVIVNDGSKDKTLEIVKKIAETNARITIIDQPNSGVSHSRNNGLEVSKGEFICFLDADDLLNPNNLEVKANALEQNKWDAVYSSCELIDKNSISQNRYLFGQIPTSIDDILELRGNYITAPSGFLYRKSIFKSIGGYDPNLSNNADQELLIKILANKFKVGYISDSLWKYRMHSGNMSSNIRLLEKDSVYMYEKLRNQNLFKNKKTERRCFAKLYYMLGGSWWINGNNKMRGCRFFLLSFFHSPSILLNKILKSE